MITTERLILRRWRDEDRKPYAAMMADSNVAYWLGGTQTHEAALETIDHHNQHIDRHGFGRFAIERQEDGVLIGAAGIMTITSTNPLAPGVEIGWSLRRSDWGHGYASEASNAALADGFQKQNLPEIVAWTAESNARSRAVMDRIGMRRDTALDFDHPRLALDHPLRRHVVYGATAQ